MFEFLPEQIRYSLDKINSRFLYEIRFRANSPVMINYKGTFSFLSESGLTDMPENALKPLKSDVESVVFSAGKYSVYSFEEQMRQGFITTDDGVRIGLCGEYVYENGKILSVRNISSLCIRIPHEIDGASDEIYKICFSDDISSVLICSSPGLGKTTILRDLAKKISSNFMKNLLICDERGEISPCLFENSCDVMKFADKKTAFEAGIRAMRPDLIVTDELSDNDILAVKKAIFGGVKVVASAHTVSVSEVEAYKGLFDFFVFLQSGKIGRIDRVYSKDFLLLQKNGDSDA